MKGLFFLFFISTTIVCGQTPQVPERMEFGGIKLVIEEPARREIQESVNSLTANPRYFNIHVQRARSYFPIIERVFREEQVPLDFKYLVLQESALIPDAVSSSDAVGFWQFKDFTALEMGLRVDRQIDERMNIVSSSRAAARYMKKNNQRYFDNWIITLMAYQMGPGAAIKAGGEKYKGQKTMRIDRRTYWYIKKFLAHKVAFEGYVEGPAELTFVEVTNASGKSFDAVAQETKTSSEKVAEYNKWLRKGKIPDDRMYTVLLPVEKGDQPAVIAERVAVADKPQTSPPPATRSSGSSGPSWNYDIAEPGAFPDYSNKSAARSGKITEINGKPAVIARVNDRAATLAGRGGISVSKFLRINDMSARDKVQEGQVYYLKNKRSKPKAYYHVVAKGENLWGISQAYGMKVSKLRQRNRIRTNTNKVEEGRILWLRYIRPSDVPVEFRREPDPVKELVAKKETSVPVKIEKNTDNTNLSASGNEEQASRQVEKREWNDTPEMASGNGQEGGPDKIEKEALDKPENDMTSEDEEPGQEVAADTPHRRIIHRVDNGETLYSISRKYEVPINEILSWNGLSINDPLSIDQELLIKKPVTNHSPEPAKEPVGSTEQYYEVKSGDTLYGIARKHNLSVEELKKLNDKTTNTIQPGDKLKVAR